MGARSIISLRSCQSRETVRYFSAFHSGVGCVLLNVPSLISVQGEEAMAEKLKNESIKR